MEEETTTTTTASPAKEPPIANESSETSDDLSATTDSAQEKDAEMTEEAAAEPKHGVKRKTRESDENDGDSADGKAEKKKKVAAADDDEEKQQAEEEKSAEEALTDETDAEKGAEEAEQKESVSSPSSQDSKDDMSMPEKQTLGKGKRARIPNKRYSDILMSPRHGYPDGEKSGKKRPENGVPLEKENLNTDSSKTGNKPPPTKPSKIIENPNYLKPFIQGWRRELVYRAALDQNAKRTVGDIYYYTPAGKKLRSMREISENLKDKDLTLEDFSFAKEPLGLDDPEKEIIRSAKVPGGAASNEGKSGGSAKKKGAGSGGKGGAGETKNLTTRGQSKQTKVDKKSNKDDEEMDMGTYPPNWQSPRRTTPRRNTTSNSNSGEPATELECASSSSSSNSKLDRQPCSILCRGVMGLVPTLQCRVCLCLYHNECVGVAPHLQVQHYECKNCQLEQDQQQQQQQNTPPTLPPPPPLPLPPLTTTNTNKIISGTAGAAQKKSTAEDLNTTTTTATTLQQTQEMKGLVGGVTTWFPPSSTIQVGSNQLKPPQLGTIQSPRPQYVEFLGDKKYLIIPKHNVVSVSPSVGHHSKRVVRKKRSMSPLSFRGFTREEVSTSVEMGEVFLQGGSKEQRQEAPKSTTTTPTTATRSSQRKKAAPSTTTASLLPTRAAVPTENFYLQHLAFGYNTLLYVFQYLKVQDLLRAGCVCQMWHDVASHSSLWRTVRMKNSQVYSFEGLAETLRKHGTVHLDLRKMLLAANGGDEKKWPVFTEVIGRVESLRRIELCRCPAAVVEQLPVSNPDLEVVNAVTIKCETMSLAPFAALKHLKELRLKSSAGLTLTSDLGALTSLTKLTHLSLTSFKDLHKQNLDAIATLGNLESLELGECNDLPKSFAGDVLLKLGRLEKLRLEKGQGDCHTFEVLEAVKEMSRLEQLELVNFDVKSGFDVALGACANIRKLLVIPTYISQSATTNYMVLGGVMRLRSTLSHFVWGVTLELLRVTELFVDQCESGGGGGGGDNKKRGGEKKTTSDCIPVLKPVPLISEEEGEGEVKIQAAFEPAQVEILSLQELQKLLLQSLPTTRVKILKIPFHATWRQSITETVN